MRAFDEARHLWRVPAGRLLVGSVAVIAVVTAVGLAVLWPRGGEAAGGADVGSLSTPTLPATVEATRLVPCGGPTDQQCLALTISVEDERVELSNLGPVENGPALAAGDAIRVTKVELAPGTPPDVVAQTDPYAFVDVDRHGSVLVLAALLAVVGLIVLRWRGLFAVVGVALSVLLVAGFAVPAILEGRPALLVAVVGSLAVMFVTTVLTNGLGAQTLAAVLGITATVALAAGLAVAAVAFVSLDGRSSELSTLLAAQDAGLSLEGVVIAGMLVGALGVIADTAVTQASAVMALRRANPAYDARALYRSAFVVGRDHLSATIHTLVLAYAGGTLPLLLVLRSVEVRTVDGLNYQDIAEPIAATVVGCLALIAAVPLTTFLASRLVTHLPIEVVPEHAHAH